MELSQILIYLAVINVVGFITYFINCLIHNRWEKNIDILIYLLALLGANVGMILSMLLFDKKANKVNMMQRVVVICLLIIDLLGLLIYKFVYLGGGLSFPLASFYSSHKLFFFYLAFINVATFICFGLDKYFAINNKTRISIVGLLTLSAMGGSIGGLIGMYLFRHKTKKNYFYIGLPLILVTQVLGFFLLVNLLG